MILEIQMPCRVQIISMMTPVDDENSNLIVVKDRESINLIDTNSWLVKKVYDVQYDSDSIQKRSLYPYFYQGNFHILTLLNDDDNENREFIEIRPIL